MGPGWFEGHLQDLQGARFRVGLGQGQTWYPAGPGMDTCSEMGGEAQRLQRALHRVL